MSDIVWTPEQGSPAQEPEVRGVSWNNLLVSDDSYSTKWRTASDIRITPDKALQSTVILSCCRIIAETIATLPLCVYRRKSDGSHELAYDVPLYKVLNFAPNSWQTKFEFVEQVCMNIGLWGNSYSQIISGRYGAVTELQNLHPSRMQVERLENGRLRYTYTNPQTGRLERYTQDQIMHVRWTPEPDGIKGMVPIEVSRDAIALARSLEIHASKFWANSARPGVVLTTDGTLSAEAAERLRDNWERIHRGSERAYKTAILTGGMKATELGFTNEASQFVDSRKYQCEELCRVYRIPMHLVQGTSGGNLEVQGQEFVTYTLMPWLDRIQSAISRSLIYNDDLLFAAFDVRGLLRSDSSSRAGYYSTMMGLGIYSVNEVRKLEGLAPLGPEADHHFVAMNMQTLEEAAKPKPDPSQTPGAPPPPATGGVPSLPGVKTGEAPKEAEKGEASTKKPEMEDAIEESSADWEDAIEGRAFCATGEGNGVKNDCSSGAGVAGVDNSWKKSSDREYSYTPGEGDSPISGGDDIRSLNIERPKDVASAMKEMKIKSLTDLVAIGGGLTRGSSTSIAKGAEGVVVSSSAPVDPDNDESSGMESKAILSVDADGKKFVDYKLMSAYSDAGTADLKGEEAARTSSLLLEKFPESLAAAERAGFSYAKTFAMGDPESEFHGYRLWPKFGFDGEVDSDLRESIPKSVIPHDDPVTIQQLISTPAGDKWWSENGSSTQMTLNFKDKKSDGYKRYQKTLALSQRLKKRNEGRSLFEVLFPECRAYCPTGEGNGTDNSCSGTGSKGSNAESLAKSMPKQISAEMAREKLPGYKAFLPIGESKNSDHVSQAADDELRQFLNDSKDPDKSQKGKVGGSRDLPEGTPVALRIDIPAFKKSEGKIYAVTVHEGKPQGGKKAFGKPLGYDSLAKLKGDVRFDSEDENRATVVAAGGGKTPLAVVNGKFDPSRNIPDDIDSWTPVGYDPAKATYFYDKRTGDEIVGGTDAISAGNTVFTRDPVRGPRNVKTRYRSEDRSDEEFSDPPPPMHLVGPPVISDSADDDAAKSASIVQSAIGRPDKLVKVYRPVHKKDKLKKIKSGDMVTISRVQAARRGKELIGKDYEIVSKVVAAKSLHNGGDGLHEWGYADSRAFCPTGDGNGIDNSCGSKAASGAEGNPSGGKIATTQEVVDEILRSIEATGGFSVHPVTAESPTTGYMCATVPNAEKIIDSKDEVTAKVIDEYLAQHKDYLSSQPKLHLGGWINAEEGKVYLDLSERFETEEEATAAGIEHKQIAIWDIANKREIRINHGDKRSAEENGEVRLSPRSFVEGDRSRDRGGEEEGGARVRGSEGESRAAGLGSRAFCPNGEGNGVDNSCAASIAGSAPSRVSQIARVVAGEGVGDDPLALLRHVGKAKQFEVIGAVQNNLTSNAEKNSKAVSSMASMAGASESEAAVAAEFARAAGGSAEARAHVSSAVGIYLASRHACPEIQFELKHDGSVMQELGDVMALTTTPAYYSVLSNKIVMNLDAQRGSVSTMVSDPKWFSTKSLAHSIAHEDGHRIHTEAIRESLGIPLDQVIQRGSQEFEAMDKKFSELHSAAVRAVESDEEMSDAIRALSGYVLASRSPREAVAEYYAKVRLGGKRSPGLDRLMEASGFPLEKLNRGGKK